ncbi:uncharacterized protein [Miscanthus floridulus]|uniref:uncharacterized protein n=1 Tax=Miscanthus floridulus TaxID=154761 RepID=UPI0034590FBB
MVSGSVLMFILAGMFFNLNLFSGISDVSAILDPNVRLILSSALSLFLPVMSYLFSEAKNGEARLRPGSSSTPSGAAAQQQTDLTLQAGVILVWMLLVELLRKKVDAIRMQGFSSTLQRAGRVVWLGSLVFINIHSSGRRIVYGILWIFCATTLVQRLAFNEFEKRSFAHGKNARLIAYYMAHALGHGHGHAAQQQEQEQASHHVGDGDGDGDGDIEQHAGAAHGGGPELLLLKKCRYIVMGEDHLVKEATADGYKLDEGSTSVVTVGDVWSLTDSDRRFAAVDRDQRLRRLCLSFALFKLLRRRFEHREPPSEEEARNSRELIFKGLYNNKPGDGSTVFQVINDEVNFLSEYYHSVVPVIFASPFFLLANYVLLPVVVFGLCVLTVILSGNGDVRYAVTSIHQDNSSLQAGIGNLTICLIKDLTKSPESFFSLLDISITFLLFIIFLYESLWEIVVFILSNWFMVSLVCNYTAKEEWCGKPTFRWAFRWIPCLRSWMSHGDLNFKQLSVLSPRLPPATIVLPFKLPMLVPSSTVPVCMKDSIMEYFVAHDHVVPISFGKSALQKIDNTDMFSNLSWAFDSKSIAEVILTWHIATDIFEEGSSSHALSTTAANFSMVATGLSRYCAYLVVFHPELLPDNQDNTERVVKLMKEELRESLGFLEFYLLGHATRVKRIMQLKGEESWIENKVVKNGVTLGASLLEKVFVEDGGDDGDDDDQLEIMVWKMLANVWTELMAYLVPSTDEERLKGHENALVQGGDFITVLWALSTHTGISRQPV